MTLSDHLRHSIISIHDDSTVFCPSGGGFLRSHELRAIADELDRRNTTTPELPENGCCTGRSPCPAKAPEPRPGAVVNANGVFCGACCSRLNVKTPPVCPDCGEDLTRKETQ
jgi:hypothetical protein